MSVFATLVLFQLLQRALELAIAGRNRRWAIRHGGRESGRAHYPVIVAVHVLFYLSLALERVYLRRDWSPIWEFWAALLVLAQALRIWAIASLGRFWNTRIMIVPGWAPSRRGPYGFIRHPNYVAVCLEILAFPMLAGDYLTAAAFSVANTLVLRVRIREEEQALRGAATNGETPLPRFFPRLGRPRSRG